MKPLHLRVDVCTRHGLLKGVPGILEVLRRVRARATFYVTFGPDASGLALLRLLDPRFALKMMRTRAGSMYGWRTALFGTLLPAPLVGSGAPEMVRRIREEGHEVGMHGWDHRRWQDWLSLISSDRLRAEFRLMVEAYRKTLDESPLSFAAPAWRLTRDLFELEQQAGLKFGSDSRGTHPFLPVYEGRPGSIPQFPVTLPTFDECLGRWSVGKYADRLLGIAHKQPGYCCYTAHAEGEGEKYAPLLESFLSRVDRPILPLGDVPVDQLRRHELRTGWVDGRVTPVALQGPILPGPWDGSSSSKDTKSRSRRTRWPHRERL